MTALCNYSADWHRPSQRHLPNSGRSSSTKPSGSSLCARRSQRSVSSSRQHLLLNPQERAPRCFRPRVSIRARASWLIRRDTSRAAGSFATGSCSSRICSAVASELQMTKKRRSRNRFSAMTPRLAQVRSPSIASLTWSSRYSSLTCTEIPQLSSSALFLRFS